MDLIQELIATGNAQRGDFEISYTGVFERFYAQLTDDISELSRKVASAQRRPSVAWSEMSQQVMGAERPPRDSLFVTYG